MTFEQYPYKRPDFDAMEKEVYRIVEQLQNTKTVEEQIKMIDEVHQLINDVDTQSNLAYIRYSINTKDTFYEKENEYWDEYAPKYEEVSSVFKKALVASAFKKELEKHYGKQYFDIIESELRTFSPDVCDEMAEENKLTSKYNKLISSAELEFNGQTYNLSGLRPFMISEDRETRRKAYEVSQSFFEANEKEIDDIFDKLVKLRDTIAKKLGFESYVEYGYMRMKRTDYNKNMVANFRKQVKKSIVPEATKLYEQQKSRLGLDVLKYYDEDFEFSTGNATPQGDADFIVENGKIMYSELSKETKEFFDFMINNDLMDLTTKAGKQAGGYCTFIPEYKAPFIFSNFNGTSGDIDVLTHEAGHAFQVYQSRHIDVPSLNWPTYESAEIHSMSMEFITWPWMERFFGNDTTKYKYSHLASAIKFIPYGVVVDEFQHYVYENVDATPEERKAAWRKIEKEYLPHKNYEGCDILESGTWWFKQGHIFKTPFYYIDYTLAQICALQFWKKMQHNREEGWQDYLNISNKGGTLSFLGLVKEGNLISPFEEGCVDNIIEDITKWLENIDDRSL
ncbi:MAG: M3 family oligoendopeptidase [Cellulosilyticaceae bacterium]